MTMTRSRPYAEFLAHKSWQDTASGFTAHDVNPLLFDFQQDVVGWATRKGKAALFLDCGLGKSAIQLDWARLVHDHTGGDVLVLAPLAVAQQTRREAEKFHIAAPVAICRTQDDVRAGINIANYEMLQHFDPAHFAGVVLDESSILKSQDGKTRTAIIEAFRATPYRLACTATPAPNDHMELGNHAEFLGAMTRAEMLAMFFTHDGGDTSQWRLKRHAERAFWEWVASWAVLMRRPADLGYPDGGFALPPLNVITDVIDVGMATDDALFVDEARTLTEQRQARKASLSARVAAVAERVNASTEPVIIWCDLNAESEALAAAIPGAVEVTGSNSPEYKEVAAEWFQGKICLCGRREFQRARQTDEPTLTISVTTTSGTGPSGLRTPPHTRSTTARLDLSTTGSTTETTSTSGLGEHQSSRLNTTPPAGLLTPKIQNEENKRSGHRASGNWPTQTSDSPNGSEDSASPQSTTTRCSTTKEASALSAEPRSVMEPDAASPSITATSQAPSEVFSAVSATSGSESSTTTQTGSNGQPCTCGHAAGRRVLVSKSSIFGWGLNFQHCSNMEFVGISHSWEAYYQAIRRCWRFGQDNPVQVTITVSNMETPVVDNIRRKEADSVRLAEGMVEHTAAILTSDIHGTTRDVADYVTGEATGDGWRMIHGDCVEQVATLPDESVGFSVFSPPFASLYTYSNSDRDMGNSKDLDQFAEHFRYLVRELYRVLKPGRLVSFHCMNLPTSKVRDGYIGIEDFRGDLIRAFREEGFIFHSEVVIWKDPVIAMQRTKALGLLHKQIKKDSCMSRQGIPDYLVTMRKPGVNPDPVEGPFDHYEGDSPPDTRPGPGDRYSIEVWQRYASPVWMDINPSDTLQYRSAREHDDERHICPLQLQVIHRALQLWSNPGDMVLSPFAGIGSEGWESIRMGRRFIGVELKSSYYREACRNLKVAVQERDTETLFDMTVA
jgi:hypothetical protein